MKRVWLTTAILFGLSSPALADNFKPGFYVTGAYEQWMVNYRPVVGVLANDGPSGMEVGVGYRFNRFYSMEIDYAYAFGDRSLPIGQSKVSANTVNIDAMGYLPIRTSNVALFGDIGITAVVAAAHGTSTIGTYDADETRIGARIGGGLQWQVSEDFGVRAALHYQYIGTLLAKSGETADIGFVFQL